MKTAFNSSGNGGWQGGSIRLRGLSGSHDGKGGKGNGNGDKGVHYHARREVCNRSSEEKDKKISLR
jgi:hypothetical protein